jgi:hypothetical protein
MGDYCAHSLGFEVRLAHPYPYPSYSRVVFHSLIAANEKNLAKRRFLFSLVEMSTVGFAFCDNHQQLH